MSTTEKAPIPNEHEVQLMCSDIFIVKQRSKIPPHDVNTHYFKWIDIRAEGRYFKANSHTFKAISITRPMYLYDDEETTETRRLSYVTGEYVQTFGKNDSGNDSDNVNVFVEVFTGEEAAWVDDPFK